ncbi:MAG: DUF1553 domain-containing protein [Verrucomicrobia bacterium]|nr:DUF1553 domain-containing protein [Verrucomicrobiota bacterium]
MLLLARHPFVASRSSRETALRRGAALFPRKLASLLLLCVLACSTDLIPAQGRERAKAEDLWSLKPLAHPAIPQGFTSSTNAIDAFLGRARHSRGVQAVGPAEKRIWLRRVTFDLIGLPPTPEEQSAFLEDKSPQAEEKLVERLLASEQHGVRYGRHWLDVLRYADVDENMPAAGGIHLWRDWVVDAINHDLAYDAFARAQILGNRAARRRVISAAGHLTRVEPRPEDLFALGFLARGATSRTDADQSIAFSAVETISSAFLGMTVGCAKCHDHFYDPILQSDFYAMKSLFDPLVLRDMTLATTEQILEQGQKVEEHERELNRATEAMRAYVKPYHDRLYEERLSSMTPEVQSAIRKPESRRSAAEQKTYDDYYPILRIDPPKIKAIMPREQVKQYDTMLAQIQALKAPAPLPTFCSVEDDAQRAGQPRYVLTSGDPERPRKSQPVKAGFPFSGGSPDFREGLRETFVDWLTNPANPLFARVAVNRVWHWHFGETLHASISDFGALGGSPRHPELLDWLASEFVAHGCSMKWLHRFILNSDAYRGATSGGAAQERENARIDPDNLTLWKFPLRRLEAEPIRDSILAAAGTLDLRRGGPSFEIGNQRTNSLRRAAYMARGYRSSSEAMPDYLQTFDAEDGRAVCPRRTQTVTAPQALFLMNSEAVNDAAGLFAKRLRNRAGADPAAAVALGFEIALGRDPTGEERQIALDLLQGDADGLKNLCWILFNLDEFLYVR